MSRMQDQTETALRMYLDEEITMARAAEIARITIWNFRELLADQGMTPSIEARLAEELDDRIRKRRR